MSSPSPYEPMTPDQLARILEITGKPYEDCTELELVTAGIEPLNPFTRRRVDPIVRQRLGKPWSECTMAEIDGLLLCFEAEGIAKDAAIERLRRDLDD